MGLLRVFLALCVIAGHTDTTVFRYIGTLWPTFATQIFFIISGFYMALILDGPYKGKPAKLFYISRAARIYPAYWVSLVLCVCANLYTEGPAHFDFLLNLPWYQQAYLAFSNLFIFGSDFAFMFCIHDVGAAVGKCHLTTDTLLNIPAWSIANELIFYLLAPWVATSLKRSLILIGIGAAYMACEPIYMSHIEAFHDIVGYSPQFNEATFVYYLFPSSFITFGGGIVAYYLFYKRNILEKDKKYGNAAYWIFCAAAFLIIIKCPHATVGPWWEHLALLLALPTLFAMTRNNKIDRLIGELSYPIYIVHRSVLVALANYHFSEKFTYGSAVALISIVLGGIMYLLVDRPIDRWRHGLLQKEIVADALPSSDVKAQTA